MIGRALHRNGHAIILSWPETKCKQTGAWYEFLMRWLKFNKNGYYKVGHSAIVLISDDRMECEYFDFGRYHSPVGHGRVRNMVTDHDLKIETRPVYNTELDLQNEGEILKEIHENKSCHGSGYILSSSQRVDVERARKRIEKMCQIPFIRYGPLIWNGTNCSRFTASVLNHAGLSFTQRLKLNFQITLSSSPVGNVKALNTPLIVTGMKQGFLKTTEVRSRKLLTT